MTKKLGEFIIDLNAERIMRGIDQIATSTVNEIKAAVRDIAFAAHSSIVASATKSLNNTRKPFLDGLHFTQISPNNYVIYLDGKWPNAIEDGWKPYDMKDSLLKSGAQVSEGSRAGQSWVQKGKKGQRYARVPFEHAVSKGAAAGASDLAGIIKGMQAANRKTQKMQPLSQVFKDEAGKPMTGKVATFRYPKEDIEKGLWIPSLEGLTKYQQMYKTKSGKDRVRSVYMTYRTISDLSPSGKWYNKGYQGLNSFQEAERYVDQQLKIILDTLLR